MKKNMVSRRFLWATISVLFCAGCTPAAGNVPVTPSAAPVTPQPIKIETATKLPVPTLTPLPTLTSDEKEKYILEMIKTNAGCRLPCWWGIEPGRTTWSEVEAMLLHLGVGFSEGIVEDKFGYGTGGLALESIGTSTSVDFYVRQELVEDITIVAFGNSHTEEFREAWEYYSSDKILLQYGRPSRIQLYVSTYGTTSYAGYEYWLYYDNLGFLIIYGGATKKGNSFQICPDFSYDQDMGELLIYLQSPNSDLPLETVVGEKRMQLIRPLLEDFEDVTGKSIEEYYNGFLADQKNICFDTSAEFWP